MKISSLIILSAMAAATTAESAHAEILTMTCEGYNVVFSPGSLTSHAPKKDRDYPITKVDVQNDRTIVSGTTKYGKITAFFSKDGHSSIVWTNGKDVVLNQCVSETAAMAAPRTLQESRSEADEAAARLKQRLNEPNAPLLMPRHNSRKIVGMPRLIELPRYLPGKTTARLFIYISANLNLKNAPMS